MLIYNNIVFTNLYCKILCNLININNDFSELLLNNCETLKNIQSKLLIPNNGTSDVLESINKNNDKYKSFILFYINCFINNLLPNDIFFETISKLQNDILCGIKIENNKNTCEILNEFLFFFISKSYELLKIPENNEKYLLIYKNIETIKLMKNKDFPSISNKIIFKHMDLYDKFPPNKI